MNIIAEKKIVTVDSWCGPTRLDTFLALKLPRYTRSFFKQLIDDGQVQVNGKVQKKAGFVVKEGDEIVVLIPDFLATKQAKDVSSLAVRVVYEHPDFLIIEKGAGVLVHAPNDKCDQLTLVDWLIATFKEISEVGSPDRPGIVHRLDMDTSGLMIVPRNNFSHKLFSDMFKDRMINKTYYAIVEGHSDQEGVIDYPIARHPVIKTRMAHVPPHEKSFDRYPDMRDAQTRYRVITYFEQHTLLELKPTTGRTHQIRVHCAAIGHPLLGDTVYGKLSSILKRHALHAQGLSFVYDGKPYSFESSLPDDMQQVLSILKPYQTTLMAQE